MQRADAHMAPMSTMTVCRNFVIHEWEGVDNDLYAEMTEGTYPVQKDGQVKLPEAPGARHQGKLRGVCEDVPVQGDSVAGEFEGVIPAF